MNIIISNANNRPIYEQIYEGVRSAIISQELTQGEALPSIRNLAKDLRISVITTKRAYDELERDGYIHSVPSKGFYVSHKNTEFIKESRLREMEEHMNKILVLSQDCGMGLEEIIEMFRVIVEKE